MEIPGIILRLIAVSLLAAILSILATLVIKATGVDLKDFRQRTKPVVLLIAMFFNLLFILVIYLIMRFWDQESILQLGFSLDTPELIFSVLALIISVSLALIFVWFLHSRKILSLKWAGFSMPGNKKLTSITLGYTVLFVAALQEEIMFRGYFVYLLLPAGFWYALIISALLFTLWHFLTNKVNIFQFTDWLLGGIMLFYIYWLSGSIWVSALVHFSRNLTNVLVFNISGSNSVIRYENPISPSYKTLYTILYSIVIMLTGYLYFGSV